MKRRKDGAAHQLPTHEEITRRAREIYRECGSRPGHETDDWLQAEYELMQLPVDKIARLGRSSLAKDTARKLAVVSLVQAALLLGAGRLSQRPTEPGKNAGVEAALLGTDSLGP